MRVVAGRSRPQTQLAFSSIRARWRAAAWPGLLLAAFALRLHRLGAQSLWFDEGVTLHLATSSLPQIVADRAANIHPPLYFFLMKGWVDLAGVHVFADRYASVLISLVLIPATFALVHRWMGRGVAWAATLFAAFAPLFIIYAQELRVYALLPLVGLLLLYQSRQLLNPPEDERPPLKRDWLWYGLLLWLGLHLHYVVAFLAVYVALWSLLGLWRRRPPALRVWLGTHLLVALFGLPWLLAVVANWPQVQQELTAGYELAQPAPLAFVLEQVWLFHWTGLAGALELAPLRWLGRALALLLALLLLLRRGAVRRPSLALLAHWALPLAAAFSLWSVRASAHPRYLTLFAMPLFLLAARLVTPSAAAPTRAPTPRRALRLAPAVALGLALLLLGGQALRAYFEHPTLGKKDDMRGVARYLEATATAQDAVLAPYKDWSLSFEYDGEAPLMMPNLKDRPALWADLQRVTAVADTVFLVRHETGSLDWQQLLPYALERAGLLHEVQEFEGLTVYAYRLREAAAEPTASPPSGHFGPLRLAGADVQAQSSVDGAVTVALAWEHVTPHVQAPDAQAHNAPNYRLSLALRDVDGWPIHLVDELLVSDVGRGTSGWPAGERVTTYHLLPVPPGTPPLTYTVTAEVYTLDEGRAQPLPLLDAQGAPAGARLALGTTQLTPAEGASAYGVQAQPPAWEDAVALAPDLQLLAAEADRETVAPGQSVFVRLRWQAGASSLPGLQPQLGLWRDGELIAAGEEAPVLARYPTSKWVAGEIVAEHRRLAVPATVDGGPAELFMTLDGQRVKLGEVTVDAVARQFEQPPASYEAAAQFGDVARLVGFDLSQTAFEPGQTITLTLYWEALATGAEPPYTVFTHLLAQDGRIVAQDDAPPGQGQRPTNGWVAGEYVVDAHFMDAHFMDAQEAVDGPLRVAVGLYDPRSGERLQMPDGSDAYVLPVQLTIAAQEEE